MHILFDDVRNLEGMDIILRTSEAMVLFIQNFNTSGHFVYFDSDIGDPSIQGYHILRRLLEKGQRPSHVCIVTSNPVDAENMRVTLVEYGYNSKDRKVYFKV